MHQLILSNMLRVPRIHPVAPSVPCGASAIVHGDGAIFQFVA